VSAYDEISLNLGTGGDPRRVDGRIVSGELFPHSRRRARTRPNVFGGRRPRTDTSPVAVISRALWTTQFASDPGIVGRSITLTVHHRRRHEGRIHGLSFDTGVWVPMMISLTASKGTLESQGGRWLGTVGGLRRDVTLEAPAR
jgi:hypothetical protein